MNDRSDPILPGTATPTNEQFETQGIRLAVLAGRLLAIVATALAGHVVVAVILAARGSMSVTDAPALLTSGMTICFILKIPEIIRAVGELEEKRSIVFTSVARGDHFAPIPPPQRTRQMTHQVRHGGPNRRRPRVANARR